MGKKKKKFKKALEDCWEINTYRNQSLPSLATIKEEKKKKKKKKEQRYGNLSLCQ